MILIVMTVLETGIPSKQSTKIFLSIEVEFAIKLLIFGSEITIHEQLSLSNRYLC